MRIATTAGRLLPLLALKFVLSGCGAADDDETERDLRTQTLSDEPAVVDDRSESSAGNENELATGASEHPRSDQTLEATPSSDVPSDDQK